SVNDNGNTGTGGPLTGNDNATINITAVNDAPVATITPASYSATEQTALNLKNNGLAVSDVDAGTGSVTATLSVTEGTLTVTAGTSGALVSGSGTGTVTINGTLAQINALLNTDATSTVSYIDNTDTPSPNATLSLSVNDNGNTGTGGPLTGNDNATINITAVNDAPVATITPASYSATEQTTLDLKNNGLAISDVDAGTGSVTATLSVTEGTLNVTAGTSGAGVSGSGTGTVTLTGTLAQINALLNTDGTSTISYIDNTNTPSASATLSFSVNDNGNTGTGGPLTGNDSATINITAVNDAPAGADNTVTALQNQSYTFAAADFGFTDPNDNPPDSLAAVKITTLPTAGALTDNGNAVNAGDLISIADITGGLLVFTPAANASGTPYDSFTFQVEDNGSTANGGVNLDQSPNTMTVDVDVAPVASDDGYITATNTPLVVDAAHGVQANDNDPDSASLNSILVAGPSNGVLNYLHSDGSFSYTPNNAFSGTDSFTYKDNDGFADSNTATVTITVASGQTFHGTTNNDVFFGGPGPSDDVVYVSAGIDSLDGGGNTSVGDTIVFDTDQGITATINTPTPFYTVGGSSGLSVVSNFENMTGSDYDDVLTGDSGNNVLDGANGNDILVATTGQDTLKGGNGNDTADFTGFGGGVTIDLTIAGPQSLGGADTVTLNSIENLTGGSGDDTFTGDSNDNLLTGGDGNNIMSGGGSNDILVGGSGDDTMDGGTGDDLLDGGTGTNDTAVYGDGTQNGLVVNLLTGTSSGGGLGNDSLINIQNVQGSTFNDTLVGDAGNNLLSGDSGNDVLFGHGGTNILLGGNDTDVAYYLGRESAYSVTGTLLVTGGPESVNDSLSLVERLKFLAPSHVSDVDNNGRSDLVFQEVSTGNLQINEQPSGTLTPASGTIGSDWHAIGTGQFTPDAAGAAARASSVLLQYTGAPGPASPGDMEIITAGGTKTLLSSPTGTFTGWTAVSAGDFNGDGASDILLRNGSGGAEIAFLNGTAGAPVGTVDSIATVASPGTNWRAVAAGDFNGDGKSDILWQNSVNKSVEVTLMDGASATDMAMWMGTTNLTAIGTGDFNGDGKSDILFQNTAGQAVIWYMNGDVRSGTKTISHPTGSWSVAGAGDVDGNGYSDIIWNNLATDATTATLLGGPSSAATSTVLNSNYSLSAPAGPAFRLIASTGGG
ncbi:MAG: VCBS repeat-containing protein, partial [Alphaproteobacteria bacterium]|nr:VCBS repeat-containing protein [Alphaproteobacteria bacterium]